MPEGNVTYHGSAFGDIAEEWHKLPTWGKFAVGGLFVAVAGIGYYEYSKNKSSGVTPLGSNAGSPADLSGAGANQYPTAPGGNTGNVPVLPGGICPIFDSSGNLVAFGPCTDATGGTNNGGTPPGGTKPPQPTGTCPPGMHKGKVSGLCKCNEPNMINLGTHCVPKPGTTTQKKSTTQHSGGPAIETMPPQPVGTRQFQRYFTNENGHMETVRHGTAEYATGKSIDRTMPPQPIRGIYPVRPIINNHRRIMPPQLKSKV